jgi:hypothetical protein
MIVTIEQRHLLRDVLNILYKLGLTGTDWQVNYIMISVTEDNVKSIRPW